MKFISYGFLSLINILFVSNTLILKFKLNIGQFFSLLLSFKNHFPFIVTILFYRDISKWNIIMYYLLE